MMFGSGFLRQMNETIKYNRDLLRKKMPFQRNDLKRTEKTTLSDNKKLSDKETKNLIEDIKRDSRQQRKKELWMLLIAVGLTLIFILLFKATLLDRVIDFLKK
jgi:hypothetical protein